MPQQSIPHDIQSVITRLRDWVSTVNALHNLKLLPSTFPGMDCPPRLKQTLLTSQSFVGISPFGTFFQNAIEDINLQENIDWILQFEQQTRYQLLPTEHTSDNFPHVFHDIPYLELIAKTPPFSATFNPPMQQGPLQVDTIHTKTSPDTNIFTFSTTIDLSLHFSGESREPLTFPLRFSNLPPEHPQLHEWITKARELLPAAPGTHTPLRATLLPIASTLLLDNKLPLEATAHLKAIQLLQTFNVLTHLQAELLNIHARPGKSASRSSLPTQHPYHFAARCLVSRKTTFNMQTDGCPPFSFELGLSELQPRFHFYAKTHQEGTTALWKQLQNTYLPLNSSGIQTILAQLQQYQLLGLTC